MAVSFGRKLQEGSDLHCSITKAGKELGKGHQIGCRHSILFETRMKNRHLVVQIQESADIRSFGFAEVSYKDTAKRRKDFLHGSDPLWIVNEESKHAKR